MFLHSGVVAVCRLGNLYFWGYKQGGARGRWQRTAAQILAQRNVPFTLWEILLAWGVTLPLSDGID